MRLFGAGEALAEASDVPEPPFYRAENERYLAAVRSQLGEAAFVAAWEYGRAMSVEEAVAEAIADTAPDGDVLAVRTTLQTAGPNLAPREVEVLRLLPEGFTNAQIAAALFITTRTAQTHVQHIFDKLDVSTRAEAAAYATKLGLLT